MLDETQREYFHDLLHDHLPSAIRFAAQMMREHPDDAEPMVWIAGTLLRDERYEQSEQYCRDALLIEAQYAGRTSILRKISSGLILALEGQGKYVDVLAEAADFVSDLMPPSHHVAEAVLRACAELHPEQIEDAGRFLLHTVAHSPHVDPGWRDFDLAYIYAIMADLLTDATDGHRTEEELAKIRRFCCVPWSLHRLLNGYGGGGPFLPMLGLTLLVWRDIYAIADDDLITDRPFDLVDEIRLLGVSGLPEAAAPPPPAPWRARLETTETDEAPRD